MSAPDRSGDASRQANYEKLLGKYADELMHPKKYDHEESKADKAANDESLFATEGRVPESWTEK
jgi:hypothetical protein